MDLETEFVWYQTADRLSEAEFPNDAEEWQLLGYLCVAYG